MSQPNIGLHFWEKTGIVLKMESAMLMINYRKKERKKEIKDGNI